MSPQSYPADLLPFMEEDNIFQPEWRGDLPESVSVETLATYLVCPQRFKLTHLDVVPWDFIPSDLAINMAVQHCLRTSHRHLREGNTLSLPALLLEFDDYWREHFAAVRLEPETDHFSAVERGHNALRSFSQLQIPHRILKSGESIRRPLVNCNDGACLGDLEERIGLVSTDRKGFITIVHQTVDGDPASELESFRLNALAYLIRSHWDLGEGPIPVRTECLSTEDEPQTSICDQIIDDRDELHFVEQAQTILRGIRDHQFSSCRGDHCSLCPVATACHAQAAESDKTIARAA